MKTIVIGDIHGRSEWKKIVSANGNPSESVQYIFLGDYVDSHEDILVSKQCANFKDIVEFKMLYPRYVTLLLGNHDMHYYNMFYRCSQFSMVTYNNIHQLMKECVDNHIIEFGVIDFDSRMIFTHAGITQTWLKNHYGTECPQEDMLEKVSIEHLAFQTHNEYDYSLTGDDEFQSPTWVRPNSLLKDAVVGFTQFIGHTRLSEGSAVKITNGVDDFYLCDSIPNQYIEIDDDGEISIKDV